MRIESETLVGIKFEIEGMHSYPDAVKNHGEGVEFLEYPHRHRFFFNCKKRVNHDNRDEEFILLKNKVENRIKMNTPIIASTAIYDFGSRSCEQLAKSVLKEFDFEEVEVSEDGENYAVVRKVQKQEDKEEDSPKVLPITFVVGGCCSGKTEYVDKLFLKKENGNCAAIEIGSIVRACTNSQARVYDKDLSQEIVDKVQLTLSNFNKSIKRVIIVGCRQIEVFKGIMLMLDWTPAMNIHYLSVPKTICRERFCNRAKTKGLLKDETTFDKVLEGEESIGYNKFVRYLLDEFPDKISIIKNY